MCGLIKKLLGFTSFYVQTQHTTGTSSFYLLGVLITFVLVTTTECGYQIGWAVIITNSRLTDEKKFC